MCLIFLYSILFFQSTTDEQPMIISNSIPSTGDDTESLTSSVSEMRDQTPQPIFLSPVSNCVF